MVANTKKEYYSHAKLQCLPLTWVNTGDSRYLPLVVSCRHICVSFLQLRTHFYVFHSIGTLQLVCDRCLFTDIDPKIKVTTLEHVHIDAVPVQLAKQPTNGITYFKAVASITSLPDELKIYVSLFCNVLTQMGAGDLDHRQFAQQVDL
ncbi:presequence protease, mitochondrial-like [Dysidea avara]|uniref:presequence protease, mitochondrial-like n=1 Tax=Dysidea avara TaxID=196820 RepID=UPI00331AA86C